ncbi:MAG: DUF4433 domain-containing protein [Desulfatibacillaceae bacterium]
MTVPNHPEIYHIVHVDRLPSIISDGCIWCDAEVIRRRCSGTTIGMSGIKQRRLELPLTSHPGLHVSDCVPFYFCPRSIMLYLLHQGNHSELSYRGGQEPIAHLVADLQEVVKWANGVRKRWAFTLSNAGSNYFEDRSDLGKLNEIDWNAVKANHWAAPAVKEGKQAEFLMEHHFPWTLIHTVGVQSARMQHHVATALRQSTHKPGILIKPDWYY